ncbi:MAG: hydroxymethylglutaryl-CoA lyase, partial [Chitinophagaceae bacterium]|nr:hydroxymethylglutaryl-CoA lyase [Chitinophagaceae bacterium]
MADTSEVLNGLDLSDTNSKLLAIVANTRGAAEAASHDAITYLGFPFSVSPTFQQRNTNSTIEQSLVRVQEIQELCVLNNKELIIYLSMGFGNPYGDAYSEDIVFQWANGLAALDIRIFSLADTVGLANAAQVRSMTHSMVQNFPNCEIGVHLHSSVSNRMEKMEAALDAGCMRFDGALNGIGGCPMADDELVGNMATEWMVDFLEEKGHVTGLDKAALASSLQIAQDVFN